MYFYRNHMQYNTGCFSAQNIIHRYDLALIDYIILISGDIFPFLLFFFFIAGVDGVVEKIEKLPIDLFAETVRCVITWFGRPTMGRKTLQVCV